MNRNCDSLGFGPPLSGMTSFECSLLDDDGWSSVVSGVTGDSGSGGGGGGGEMSREELLQLYVMKLDEEANYFKATSPVEEEFCNCPKCQVDVNGWYTCSVDTWLARYLQSGAATCLEKVL